MHPAGLHVHREDDPERPDERRVVVVARPPELRAAVWLQFKFASPTELSGYRWYTANDFEDRDPGAWRLLGSNDGANWVMIDKVTGFRATSERNKLAFSRRLPEAK